MAARRCPYTQCGPLCGGKDDAQYCDMCLKGMICDKLAEIAGILGRGNMFSCNNEGGT